MKAYFITLIFGMLLLGCQDQEQDKKEIMEVLSSQEAAWNEKDLERFMQGYWKSDSLKFYGANGITKGWQQTLDNYIRRYPTTDHTGKLEFVIDAISPIENNSYYVMGQYHLTRPIGDANGVFMIIFKKIEGEWKIVADLSC